MKHSSPRPSHDDDVIVIIMEMSMMIIMEMVMMIIMDIIMMIIMEITVTIIYADKGLNLYFYFKLMVA